MRILRSLRDVPTSMQRVCMAIGFFDGVHLGHQQVIRQTVSDARQHEASAVVVTFDRHPSTIVAPDRVPELIYSLPQKLKAIEASGADATMVLAFDEEFSRQTGDEFIRNLSARFGNIQSICVGSEFIFGHRRSGNVELLKALGRELNFAVHGLASVALDGETVSSTRIREAIRSGNLDAASQMLGRAYSFAGTVIQGDQLGRKLGFPTANLEVDGKVLPPSGVYAAHADITGQTYRAVVNIGNRPTLNQPAPRLHVEAHLLDYEGIIYGEELELTFVKSLREERKFPSLEALKGQIAKDIAAARRLFS